MLTWSISARACRSASKRAMTCRLSIPGLMTLRATWRCTGWVCSARKTVPMPPSPSCWSSLYGPITVPGPAPRGGSAMVGAAAGASRKLPARWCCSSNLSRRSRRAGSPAHTRSRKAARSAGTSFSRASMKRDCSCMAVTSTLLRVWFCISMRRWAAKCARNPEEKPGRGSDGPHGRNRRRRRLLVGILTLALVLLLQQLFALPHPQRRGVTPIRPLGPQPMPLAQVFQRFGQVALVTQGMPQVTVCLRKILLELKGFAVSRHRFGQLLLLAEDVAQVVAGRDIVRLQIEGLAECCLRFDQVSLRRQGQSQIVVGLGIILLELDGGAVGANRIIHPLLIVKSYAQVGVGLGKIGLELDRLAIGGLRGGQLVLPMKGNAEVVIGHGKVGFEF